MDTLLDDYLLYPRVSGGILIVIHKAFEVSPLVVYKQATFAQRNLDLDYHVSTIWDILFEPFVDESRSPLVRGGYRNHEKGRYTAARIAKLERRRHDEEILVLIKGLTSLFVFFPIRPFD